MVSLFCVLCGEEFRSLGTIPISCKRCLQVTKWTTLAGLDVPAVRYVLTPLDVQFLKAMKIDPELPPILERLQG